MKSIITTVAFLICIINCTSAQKIVPADLKIIEGNWVGSLTYLDYTTNKPFTMPSNTTYEQSKSNANLYFRSIGYSTEPHANQKDTMVISADGKMLDDYSIVSVKKITNNGMEIIVQKKGLDGNDNQPALIKKTITITKTNLTISKEVLFDNTKKWTVRHTYSFTKK
jgi:hypothetical protein